MTTTDVARVRTDERAQFLTDILTGAIESYPYNWFDTEEYVHDVPAGGAYAVIRENDWPANENTTFRVDLDVIERGIEVIRSAVLRTVISGDDISEELFNAETGEKLYMSERYRRDILAADRANDAACGAGDDDGDLDALSYLAILECALFGKVAYA